MLQIPNFKRYIATEAAIGIGTAAASLIGTGASAAAQSSLNKKTREFNREEAEKQRLWSEKMYNEQNAWNYEMWLKQNEYNSPEAQVQRMRDAGLNPLFYGLDGSSAGDLSAAQPLAYERAQVGNQANPLGSFDDAALKVAQIGNIIADTAKKGQETQSEVYRRQQIQAQIENIKQENKNLLAQEGLTKSQKEQIDRNNAWLDRLNEAIVAEREANAALNKSQKNRIDELLEGEKILQAKSAEDFEHKWKKIKAEIGKIAKETGILDKDIENYALNHANNGFMGTGLSLNNLFRLKLSGKPDKGAPNYVDENTDPMQLAREGQ